MKAQKKSSPLIATKRVARKRLSSARAIEIKPGSVLDRMGGMPKHLYYGPRDLSSEQGQKRAIEEYLSTKASRIK
jgi:hypothetical protein